MPTLSEYDSKRLLADAGVPMGDDRLAATADEAAAAARHLGGPVALKLCGASIAHKTERGLVRLGVSGDEDVATAAAELLGRATPDDGEVAVLVAPMVSGNRELIAGVVRDPQFGPCVMLGVGGILAEAIADVTFRLAPVDEVDAHDMIDDLQTQALLGEFRGAPAVQRDQLAAVLVGLGRLAAERPDVASVDINPLIIAEGGRPVAVDALVELSDGSAA